MALERFEEAHKHAERNVHTTVFEVMEQAVVKALSTGGAEELLHNKIDKLADAQGFSQSLVQNLMKSLTITVPITRFVKRRAEKVVASEGRFRRDITWETAVKGSVMPGPLLVVHAFEP